MSARENILQRVRQSLGRTTGVPPTSVPEARIRVPELGLQDRVDQFCAALEKLAGKTFVAASEQDAFEYVRTVVAGRAALSTVPGIEYAQIEPDRAEVGITGADFGLADTGSLVVLSATGPRLVSLLPPVHIALLRRERLLTGLDELLTVLPYPAEQTASMVLITGPSRTADIEQILVRGVHGPGELHAVLI